MVILSLLYELLIWKTYYYQNNEIHWREGKIENKNQFRLKFYRQKSFIPSKDNLHHIQSLKLQVQTKVAISY